MASTTPNRIVLSGETTHKEYSAGGAITPGMLCVLDSANEIIANPSAADVDGPALFARENLEGGEDIDDDYDDGDWVQAEWCHPGAEVYAWLKIGVTVAIGAILESDGAGNFQAHTTGKPIAQAMEAVTGGAALLRCRVRIINA